MSTDLAIHNPSTAVEMSVTERQHYASVLADANMIPKAFQKSPANIFVAIEYGNALGIAPIVALNEINVINGTPSLSASMMASLARSAGHRVRTRNEDDGSAVCEIIRADDPEFTHRSVWDEKKARDSGLWGKGHWSKDPATMLRWRAISECVRMACPEVLGGLKYTSEEVIEFTGSPEPQRAQSQPQATVPDVDFYALLDRCETQDDLRQAWVQIDRAHGGFRNVPSDLTATVKALKETLPAQVDEPVQAEVVDETTGEVMDGPNG